jgi:hypothetical protein
MAGGRFDPDKYDPVDSRLERFWAEHPQGRIDTRLMTDPAHLDEVVVWAAVWFDLAEPEPRASGMAFERRGGGGANATSHLENCETSAIGRALANAGYKASKDSQRPSREEMRKTGDPGSYSGPPRRAQQAVERAASPQPYPEATGAAQKPAPPQGGGELALEAPGEKCPSCNAPAGKPHAWTCAKSPKAGNAQRSGL